MIYKKNNMKNFKIDNFTIEFNILNIIDDNVNNLLNSWCKLVEEQNKNEYIWTILPYLPQYKFKNLRFESEQLETTDQFIENITLIYDSYDKIGIK